MKGLCRAEPLPRGVMSGQGEGAGLDETHPPAHIGACRILSISSLLNKYN